MRSRHNVVSDTSNSLNRLLKSTTSLKYRLYCLRVMLKLENISLGTQDSDRANIIERLRDIPNIVVEDKVEGILLGTITACNDATYHLRNGQDKYHLRYYTIISLYRLKQEE
jgi:hypothetical protein